MVENRYAERLGSVTYTYVGTDQEFDEILKMLIHDYLAVDLPYQKDGADDDCHYRRN